MAHFCPQFSLKTVGLPWKGTQCVVSDHLTLCEACLKSLLKRIRLNPKILNEYDKVIKDQLSQGIVEYFRVREA